MAGRRHTTAAARHSPQLSRRSPLARRHVRDLAALKATEDDVAADELAEVADAGAEQRRHLADAELVDEAEVERLLEDVIVGGGERALSADVQARLRLIGTRGIAGGVV